MRCFSCDFYVKAAAHLVRLQRIARNIQISDAVEMAVWQKGSFAMRSVTQRGDQRVSSFLAMNW